MLIKNTDFTVIDWSRVPVEEHPGEAGVARWQTVELGNARVRFIEYTPGYRADHWCERGHVVHVIEGELVTELQDGRVSVLKSGMTYVIGDEHEPHRSRTDVGAKLFVVD